MTALLSSSATMGTFDGGGADRSELRDDHDARATMASTAGATCPPACSIRSHAALESDVIFGLRPSEPTRGAWWGARAIYYADTFSFDLVQDRTSWEGGTEPGRAALSSWLEKLGLPSLRRELRELRLEGREDFEIEMRDGGYALRANPLRSYGYLHIGAWRGS